MLILIILSICRYSTNMESKKKDSINVSTNRFELSKSIRDSTATTSKDVNHAAVVSNALSEHSIPWYRKLGRCLYNKNEGTVCGRTGKNWLYIVSYSIIYLLFLSTYTMVILYATLTIIKTKGEYRVIEKTELMTYAARGIGLSATPTSVGYLPLIWYRNGDKNDYRKYIEAIDQLLSSTEYDSLFRISDLGPCGKQPYGYGDRPCVLIRINKQLGWKAKPVSVNSTNIKDVPEPTKKTLKSMKEGLILNCDGYHQYDKEHVGKISYFPHPPGINADLFPQDMETSSPIIAIQISEFTLGVSIAIECKLFYDGATSSVNFILYVTP